MKLEKTDIYFGLLASLFIGVYFIFIQIGGFEEYSFLRVGNGVIIYFAINESIRSNVIHRKNGYSTKFLAGIKTGIIAIAISVIGLLVYLNMKEGADVLFETAIFPAQTTNQFIASIIIEGLSSVLVLTFLSMQYWKNFRFNSVKGFYINNNSIS